MNAWIVTQRLAALIGLVILSPVLLVVAVAVVLESRGPAIFAARRVGMNGRQITMHKLRTMVWRPGEAGAAITSSDDARITRVGGWLRRVRLDELPQLWDVARGEMALVGPRPEAPAFVDLEDPTWRTILSVHPGITGPTQLRFHDEATLFAGDDPELAYRTKILPAKLRSDVRYVETMSVRGDLAILRRTLRLALTGRSRS